MIEKFKFVHGYYSYIKGTDKDITRNCLVIRSSWPYRGTRLRKISSFNKRLNILINQRNQSKFVKIK